MGSLFAGSGVFIYIRRLQTTWRNNPLKCIFNQTTGEMTRVSDSTAEILVACLSDVIVTKKQDWKDHTDKPQEGDEAKWPRPFRLRQFGLQYDGAHNPGFLYNDQWKLLVHSPKFHRLTRDYTPSDSDHGMNALVNECNQFFVEKAKRDAEVLA